MKQMRERDRKKDLGNGIDPRLQKTIPLRAHDLHYTYKPRSLWNMYATKSEKLC